MGCIILKKEGKRMEILVKCGDSFEFFTDAKFVIKDGYLTIVNTSQRQDIIAVFKSFDYVRYQDVG